MSTNKDHCTFIWFIENFSYCWHKKDESLRSPMFSASEIKNTAWYLRLNPRGTSAEVGKGLISIHLCRKRVDEQDKLRVGFEMTIGKEDGTVDFCKKISANFSECISSGWAFEGWNRFLSIRKDKFLPRDILTVRCRMWKGKEIEETAPPIIARTRIGIERISFLSTIESFSGLIPNQGVSFVIHPPNKKGGFKSCIHISDGSCCEEKVMVKIMPSNSGQILAKCELFLIKASGHKVKCAEADNRFDAMRKDIGELSLSLTKDAIMQERSEYLPQDKLSLLCECVFSTGIEFQKIEGSPCEVTSIVRSSRIQYDNIPAEKLHACPSVLNDIEGIYSTKLFTDVELKTKTNSFPVHKIVLCARSPVFKSMMSHDTQEKNSGIILVDDLDDNTVEELFLFLYTDELNDLRWENAIKLYSTADKYLIEKLRLMCSAYFIDNITTSTATELLRLADTHSDADLKDAAGKFIIEHDKEVFASNHWQDFTQTNPLYALKIMNLKYNGKLSK